MQDGHRDNFTIYVDNGGNYPEGGCPSVLNSAAAYADESEGASKQDNICFTDDFRAAMEGIGYEYEVDLFHWHAPGARHDEAAWADRVSRPLELFKGLK